MTILCGLHDFEIPEGINNPQKRNQQFNHLNSLVEQKTSDYTFNIKSVDRFSKHKVKVAYLKSAYLAAFVALGYGYILREELNVVRKQIQNPEKNLVAPIFLKGNKKHSKGQNILNVSDPINSILVHIDRMVVLLPPVENAENCYDDIVDFVENKSINSTLTGIKLGWPSKLEYEYDRYLIKK
ncbi:MAG: hypothetical protein WD357_02565 [Gracilimonas sp.]